MGNNSAPWWLSTARRWKRRETMRTNGKRPRPPTRPHETVAVYPFSAITFQLRPWVHSGHHICLFLLSSVSSCPSAVSLSVSPCCPSACCRKTARHMVVAAKYTVASGHACVGCVLWRSETAFGGSPSPPSILLSETPLVTG